jgi:hypothetical protein
MTWHGVGKLQSASGANYGLFIEVNLICAASKTQHHRRH